MRVFHLLGIGTSAIFGIVLGYIATLVVFAFAATIGAAYPPWSHGFAAFIVLCAFTAISIAALSTPLRHEHATVGARALAGCALATLLFLVAGEAFGVVAIAGAHRPFYVTPAVPAPRRPG